jgi:hypothetical protein
MPIFPQRGQPYGDRPRAHHDSGAGRKSELQSGLYCNQDSWEEKLSDSPRREWSVRVPASAHPGVVETLSSETNFGIRANGPGIT